VWPAALTLLDHLRRPRGDLARLPAAARVLELGAGTGWMALRASADLERGAVWVATETSASGAVDRLDANLAAFAAAAFAARASPEDPRAPRGVLPRAAALDWDDVERSPLSREPWDLIVGSDLAYSAEGAAALARCLARLVRASDASAKNSSASAARSAKCVIAQTCGRWGGYGFDEALHAALAAEGLDAVAVGGEVPEGEEARQHVVVFEIVEKKMGSTSSSSGAGAGAGGGDAGTHPLLRAAALRRKAEAEAEAGATEEERAESAANEAFDALVGGERGGR
jgi:SAM-dependent methyltransferase